MMAVIEPQFQRDFISLLPKGKKNCKNALSCPYIAIIPEIVPEIVLEIVLEIAQVLHMIAVI